MMIEGSEVYSKMRIEGSIFYNPPEYCAVITTQVSTQIILWVVYLHTACVRVLNMEFKAILVTILCFMPLIEGGKILFWCPFASKSVKITFIPLLDELAK